VGLLKPTPDRSKGWKPDSRGLAQMRPERLFALIVALAGRAFPPEVAVGNRGLPDDPDPLVLGLPPGSLLDDIGDATGLLLEHRGRVRRHTGLGEPVKNWLGKPWLIMP
jgi:hypothetical protein